jgi:uncharacterized protein YukE
MSNAEFNIPATLVFIDKLKSFSQCLSSSKNEIEGSLKQLGIGWKDEKYTEFKEEFERHFKDLEELSEALKAYENHVEKDLLPSMEAFLGNKLQ